VGGHVSLLFIEYIFSGGGKILPGGEPHDPQPGYACENVFSKTVIVPSSALTPKVVHHHHLFSIAFDLQTIRENM
jgi:hypothetical protein